VRQTTPEKTTPENTFGVTPATTPALPYLPVVANPVSIGTTPTLMSKPTIATAISAFNARRFGEALRQFQILDRTGFCCDKVHYYIARCYQQLSQVGPALDNYAWVMSYSKNPTLQNYAEVASAQLSKYQQHRTYEGARTSFG
jgi:hypothetical protein